VTSPSLEFLPLGGTGEIGMNLNLYTTQGRWLMVDAGVMFERTQGDGMRVLYPDPAFIAPKRDKLDGLVLTHAHQDHLGAVADLWPQLRCTVYATPFAAAMLEGPLVEAGLYGTVPIHVIPQRARFRVGPFDLQRVPLTHSTVEMGALVIRAAGTTVFHTGDFKLDADPVVGRGFDQRVLERIGQEGVDVVVSDSTNADHEGWTGSEGGLVAPLRSVLKQQPGRIAVTLFSSNIARVQTLADIAADLGRDLILVGRSLERTVKAAQRCGYLQRLPAVVPSRHYGFLPRDRVMLLCTGSQGEVRAALSRMASNDHRRVYLESGDTVVFSARAIPGNELALARLHMLLGELGVKVITSEDQPVHVSGHPRREELRTLYRWLRPRHVLPVHGTPPKLEAHAELAEEMGLGAVRLRNGQRVRLGPGTPERLRSVRTGRLERVERDRWAKPPRQRRSRRRRRSRRGRRDP